MKLIKNFVSLAFVLMTLGTSGFTDESSLLPQDLIKQEWIKYSSPNENHEVLDFMVGEWNYTVQTWLTPSALPIESKGTNIHRWILGNRFMLQEVKGGDDQHPFEGVGITGYNNLKEEYSSVWVDDRGTGMMISTALYDPATKTFSETGTYTDPLTGEKNRNFRGYCQIIDQDH